MADIVFVLVTLAFFGLGALYVRGLERIVGTATEAGDAPNERETRDGETAGVAS